jgi:hypothetical protein
VGGELENLLTNLVQGDYEQQTHTNSAMSLAEDELMAAVSLLREAAKENTEADQNS